MNYTVSTRGPVPTSLEEKMAEAHAKAVMAKTKHQDNLLQSLTDGQKPTS